MNQRVYGGRTADDRRSERRERWIASGLELFGTLGLRATSLRALARHSGVAERYFAENFTGLEDLLAVVHDRIHREMTADVIAAFRAAGPDTDTRIRAGLASMVDAFDADPRKARVKLVESVTGGPEVEAGRQTGLLEIAGYLAGQFSPAPGSGVRQDVLAVAVVGGLFELLAARYTGRLSLTRDELITHCEVLLRVGLP